jgi:hypothetical protein
MDDGFMVEPDLTLALEKEAESVMRELQRKWIYLPKHRDTR